jgi:hypothetical protein
MKSWLVVLVGASVFLLVGSIPTSHGGEKRAKHAGYIQSVRPSDGTLLIEEVGRDGAASTLHVRMRNAAVVRLWRDPADPWVWRERATSIYRWPVGTFVVVIGRATPSGSIDANRIEIPKITAE